MPDTSDEQCPYPGCDRTIHIPVPYKEGKVVTCPHCEGESELRKVLVAGSHPRNFNPRREEWYLKVVD